MRVYSAYSELELTALLQAGDRLAFTEIFNRYSPLLYKHTYNKLRNAEEAEDIVQEIFARLWSKHGEIDVQMLNLTAYLYTTARNAVFDLLRHKTHVDAYATAYTRFAEETYVETDALVRERQFAAIIEAEIAALPPKMREVFNLRRLENLSNKEIAERLGLSEHTVKDQMKKAIRTLKPKIGMALILAYLMQ
ncbi:RNA polymerase sigma-70 factor [Pedobacter sp. JY14-1]|uniref:RNA polymerase sigma factor n=1 Tax=Pedobacter sp. JY14-1 TaxID=3034151 RepID=UPI0023E260CA|nr:RNA polymerase sigma-70 factor [Pedobacter sp. JY14-1]